MAPAPAVVALRTVTFALALAFGHFVSFASVSRISRPEVPIVAPPVAVLVKIPFNVSKWVLIFTIVVDTADFLIHVIRICVEAFATSPIFTFAVQFLVCFIR